MHWVELSPALFRRSPSASGESRHSPFIEGFENGDAMITISAFLRFFLHGDFSDPRRVQLPEMLQEVDLWHFLKPSSYPDLLKLSKSTRQLSQHVDEFFIQKLIEEIFITVFTFSDKSGDKDYQHLHPVLVRTGSELWSDTLVLFELGAGDAASQRYSYNENQFNPVEIRLRFGEQTAFTWVLHVEDVYRRAFGRGRLENPTVKGDYAEFIFRRSDIELSLYYAKNEDDLFFKLIAATVPLECIRNWISRGSGELE